MKRFRVLWLFVLAAVTASFLLYQGVQALSAKDGGPQFTVAGGALEVSVQDGPEALLQGVTAQDGRDGDVTDSILVEKLSDLYDGNRRLVTYAAFDSDDNVAKTSREVVYTDYTAPRFSLNHALRWRIGENMDLTQLVQAGDTLDGDLTGKVKVRTETTISSRTAGIYPVTFSVTNSAGDTQTLDTQVEIYEPQANEAVLELTDYLVYWEGEEMDYRSYLQSVTANGVKYSFQPGSQTGTSSGGDSLSRTAISVQSQLDTDQAGVYPVYLTYQDDGCQGTTLLLVVVE
ncbi:MAG: hypothetical protein ACI3VN_04075 [Candidatus Onthomonas sp.]